MSDSPLQAALIIGGGISGLTLAAALSRRGVETRVVELRDSLAEQPGVGLSLQGNSLAALAHIDLADACIDIGVPANHLNLRRADGTLVARQPILQMGGPRYPATLGISRNRLHALLVEAASRSGAEIRLGTTVTDLQQRPAGVEVTASDGSVGCYDLVVGADGVHSRTRAGLMLGQEPRFCGQAVWRAAIPRPAESDTSELHFGGPHGVVGICPISSDEAYLYIVEAAAADTRYDGPDAVAVMIDKLRDYGGLVRDSAPHLRESRNVTYRLLEWLLVPVPWYRGRIVIIGDAAHCGPPVIAQGAAMGIEDAVVLAESLTSFENSAHALESFMQRRYPRASMVVRNSVQLCEWEVNHTAGPAEFNRVLRESQEALSQPC